MTNGKMATVNGAGPGAYHAAGGGRACESCYSKLNHKGWERGLEVKGKELQVLSSVTFEGILCYLSTSSICFSIMTVASSVFCFPFRLLHSRETSLQNESLTVVDDCNMKCLC